MIEPSPRGPTVETVPEGDTRTRLVCPDCGYIEYGNPKIVVGAICTWEGRILLCRRAIAPRIGYWTFPAGFMERGESAAQGALREVEEEARARAEIEDLLGVYEIPQVGHVYLIYRARLLAPDCGAGPESREVGLFDWNDIPWADLAFSSVAWGLERFREGGGPHFLVYPA
ncbi:MAG: NUDIX hydrolase [Magnetospirillum sp. WYHS-4]